MRGRIFQLVGACAGVVAIAALAQNNLNPAPSPAETPAASPAAVDDLRPSSVTTPTSDAEMNAAGQPLAPRATGPDIEADTTMQPEEQAVSDEAVVAEQSLLPEETRKRWRIIPLFSAGVVYDDNIFLTNENRVPDFIWTLSAGLAFELGDFRGKGENYLTGYWLGIPVFYTNNPEQNAFNQSAAFLGQYRWNKLVARLQSNFAITKGPNREVNTITTSTSFSNSLRFEYEQSEKTSFDLGASQNATLLENFENTYQYELQSGIDYQLFPKTRVGVAGVGGIQESASEPLQYYQQGLVRAYYSATEKLGIRFNGGVEVREFEGGGDIKISPIFRLGVDYRPFDGTSFSIAGYRDVVASNALAGQDFTATGFEIMVEQRFFQKFIAAVSFGYENDSYFSTGNARPTDRVDNYMYVRPIVRYSLVQWLSATVFYEFRQTDSTQSESSFYDNRVGMEIALRF